MRERSGLLRACKAILAFAVLACFFTPAIRAGTTGTIVGTVTASDSSAPIAGVHVTASSPSGSRQTTTDARGFYSLQALVPDTYTVSFQADGYTASSTPGIFVQQDLTSKLDQTLRKSLKTIATVQAHSAGNLVKGYTGTDVYDVSGQQLNAATGGDNLHRTIYEYLATVPGVSPIGGGFPAEPSIRGGYDVDNGYELDGVPITERVTGYFTTNLTDLGIANVEVYTGGLGANNAGNGLGVINSVMKVGTYPGFASLSAGFSGPDYGHYLRMEYGGATQSRRYSWYLAFDGSNTKTTLWTADPSVNVSIPVDELGIDSGSPGQIVTKDFIANFHYRPNDKNDIQFFYQNSLYDGESNYNLFFGTPSDPYLTLTPCPGAQRASSGGATDSNAVGGTAPNGQTCPLGLYWSAMANGTGNEIGHYSGIGKIQWNHILNEHSSIAFKLAENFNQYIWQQPFADSNIPGPSGVDPTCPDYPYAPGTPEQSAVGDPTTACDENLGLYYQDRNAHQYYASIDYTSNPTENFSYKVGIGDEYDKSYRNVAYPNRFNWGAGSTAGGCYGDSFSYPCVNAFTDIPTHVPYVYAQASLNVGRFTFQPGLRYTQMNYGFPPTVGGHRSVSFLAPSILGTYRLSQSDVARFSYAVSGQFLGNEFLYRLNSSTYNPQKVSIDPYVNHVTDFQWEHQFDNNTSIKVGPYYRASNNYFGSFTPLISISPGGVPKYGDSQLVSNVHIRDLGVELGLEHTDTHEQGISYWLSGNYNNYWTQVSSVTGGQVSFLNYPLPGYFTSKNIYVRGYQTPLFSATLTADMHSYGWHLMPMIYYAADTFYNSGGCIPVSSNGSGGYHYDLPYTQYDEPANCRSSAEKSVVPMLAPEGIGAGYWYMNVTFEKEFATRYIVGVRVSNVTNQQGWTTPCYNHQDSSLPVGYGSGCSGENGPGSGYEAPVGYVYQPITQNPRHVELFFNVKM